MSAAPTTKHGERLPAGPAPNRHAVLRRGGEDNRSLVTSGITEEERDLLEHVNARRRAALGAMNKTEARPLRMIGRMVVGLKDVSAMFDASVTLHPVYGWPYVPGQAVKGVTRSLIEEYRALAGEGDVEGAGPDLQGTTWADVLGEHSADDEPATAGQAVFYDAYPVGSFTLVVDTITPHGGTVTENPIPVPFPAAELTTFGFAVRHHTNAQAVWAAVSEALDLIGVGGKTGSGYGYFTGDQGARA